MSGPPAPDVTAAARSGRDRGGARALAVAAPLAAAAFTFVYLRVTNAWTAVDFTSYASGGANYPLAKEAFRYRVLVPWVAHGALAIPGASPLLVLRAIAFVSTWSALGATTVLLRRFAPPRAAALAALALLWPMAWNFVLLNRIYFPFDLPALAFTAVGLAAVAADRRALVYGVLVLGTLNHEAGGLLAAVFLFANAGRLPRRTLALHAAAMTLVWFAIVAALRASVDDPDSLRRTDAIVANLATLRDMALGRGNALKDWAKLAFVFGGLGWAALPLLPRVPVLFRRAMLAVGPFVLASALRGLVDEVRLYGQVVPIVAAPALFALARRAARGGAPDPGTGDD